MSIELNTKQWHKDEDKKTVYTRLDMSWYMISAYLDGVKSLCRNDDKEFNRLFNELRDYVEKRLFDSCEGEIADLYVIAEQIIKSKN